MQAKGAAEAIVAADPELAAPEHQSLARVDRRRRRRARAAGDGMKNEIAVGFDFDHTLGFDNHLEVVAFGRLAEGCGIALDVEEPRMYHALEAMLVPFRAAKEPMAGMIARFAAIVPGNGKLLEVHADELAGRYTQICYDLVRRNGRAAAGRVRVHRRARCGRDPDRNPDQRLVGTAGAQDRARARASSPDRCW